jgi:hypothetical protein
VRGARAPGTAARQSRSSGPRTRIRACWRASRARYAASRTCTSSRRRTTSPSSR